LCVFRCQKCLGKNCVRERARPAYIERDFVMQHIAVRGLPALAM
jgi:hypothetical protein